uniref:Chemokine interleukin-8-like domain-containing protein n=1 Tax=Paramormyrops kingsleyae TaxID=1676925 RepID=A0A3B3SY52_9TELE
FHANEASCCTKYSRTPIPIMHIKGVSIQKNTGICNINAVIFHTYKLVTPCGPLTLAIPERESKVTEQSSRQAELTSNVCFLFVFYRETVKRMRHNSTEQTV